MIDEFLALAYWKERKLPVIVVRLFNTVGPRQTGRYGMVIPTFVRQGLAGQPITVFGDGTQARSFTYVGDVVRAMVALIDEPRAVGQVFNIGNGAEISIGDLAERIKALTGSRSDDRADPVRRGLRGRLRGHAAARARHLARSARWSATRRPSSSTRSWPASSSTSVSSEHMPESLKIKARARARRRDRAAPERQAAAPAAARDRPRSRADPAGDRPDREHEPLQREVRVLPARRDAPQAGRDVVRAVPQDRRRVRRARHHARAGAQLRRAVHGPAARREGPLRQAEGHQGSRHDQQRLADHRAGRARHGRGRARRHQHQRRRRRQGGLRRDPARA